MTTWQGTAVGAGIVGLWGIGASTFRVGPLAMIASSVLQTLKESQSPMFFSADRPSTKEFPRSPPALPATLWCAPGFAHLKTTMEPKWQNEGDLPSLTKPFHPENSPCLEKSLLPQTYARVVMLVGKIPVGPPWPCGVLAAEPRACADQDGKVWILPGEKWKPSATKMTEKRRDCHKTRFFQHIESSCHMGLSENRVYSQL